LGAAWVCGAVHVGIDYQFTAPELSSVIGLTQAKILLYEPVNESPDPFLPLRALRKNHPDIQIVVAGDRPVPEDAFALSDLIASWAEPESALDGPSPQDPAMIFSSGTTGKPKATLGYHGNLCQRWQRLAGWLGFEPDDAHLAHLPL
jgi:long-subunit acyl-CoA synthetase (AMP-forming)